MLGDLDMRLDNRTERAYYVLIRSAEPMTQLARTRKTSARLNGLPNRVTGRTTARNPRLIIGGFSC